MARARSRVATAPPRQPGAKLERMFSRAGADPYSTVVWSRRNAEIRSAAGDVVYLQEAVEAPAWWSDTAVRIVASKYFRGAPGAGREHSVRQLFDRVVGTIRRWAELDGYLGGADAEVFADELAHVLLEQRASFNSPVWFNVGVDERPQCSACFILSLDDTMESILGLARTEGMLFKHGSGAGCNLSGLRGSSELLSTGGTASGPVPFLRGLDALAGAIKSGGRTRRAAKMALLDDDHPDIFAFVISKELEEKKAQALIAAGWDPGFASTGGAYDSVAFQNANHSVRVSDVFLQAVLDDDQWALRRVIDGEPCVSVPARELFGAICAATWACGDPGVQYRSTINGWHTCPESGPIRASNPCAEFLFLDDTACNLASINLLRFWDPERGFDVAAFVHTCELLILAQEVLVDRASYPTAAIADNSRHFRPLGLGFANLGGLLLAAGLPYDSEEGRALGAAITALLTGAGYRMSARLAAQHGAFGGFGPNRAAMLGVLERHREALGAVSREHELARPIVEAATRVWDETLALASEHGVRHAQVSALAPTGTIAFMMDCDTTGVEPELALVKHKTLVGGGSLTMVNGIVEAALERLGYPTQTRVALLEWLAVEGSFEGAPDFDPTHLPVFDCALAARPGGRAIEPRGHLRMLAALQPFVSGGISKTVNVPAETSPKEIGELYLEAWQLGIKALAIYRDGCKGSQPLMVGRGGSRVAPVGTGDPGAELVPRRRRLPEERPALTHKFRLGPHKGYITVGLYDDGAPGEVFLVMSKEGSTIAGLLDALATTVSLALQHGVPLRTLVDKLIHTRFEPSGFTGNSAIPFARSVTDYLFRWLGLRFLTPAEREGLGLVAVDETTSAGEPPREGRGHHGVRSHLDAPICHVCGALMVPSGSCYRCLECGSSSGCG